MNALCDITPEQIDALSDNEIQELHELLEQEERERVAPKFEKWRKPAPYKAACGGRGAGAKSWSIASLNVQDMYYGKIKKMLCGREIQNTLEESSYALISETIDRLGYKGFKRIPSRSRIVNEKTGGYFFFSGLKDIKAVKGKKGLEGYDRAWIDECEDIPADIWDILLPSFRKDNSELWVSFNRNKLVDPVYELFFLKPYPGTLSVELEQGPIDNPWFPERLKIQMDRDYEVRPDIAMHIWGGKPRNQGDNAVMSRVLVRQAMRRTIQAVGQKEIGVDVARFGDDMTEMYEREGMKTTNYKQLYKRDTVHVANVIWDFAGRDPSIPIKVDDTGVGGGVTDNLNRLGAKVIPINFASNAIDKDKYDNVISEMWFEFPIEEADIPDDPELLDQLAERLYDYDKNGRRTVESKKKFKERYSKSPDKADALLLCYYTKRNIMFSSKVREQLKERIKKRGSKNYGF